MIRCSTPAQLFEWTLLGTERLFLLGSVSCESFTRYSELTLGITVFISAPAYLFVLGLRNGQPVFRKETIIMIIIGSAGKSSSLLVSFATDVVS